MLKIVTYPDPFLRQTAAPVVTFDDQFHELLEQMQETMYTDDGVGLAAPQIGVSRRIVVLDDGNGPINIINPVIKASGDKEEVVEEGCLSLPGIRVPVKRPIEVIVEAVNEAGEPVHYDADGLLARIFQHEIDHLNGILIIDHLSTIQRSLIKSKLKQLEKNTLS